jgi:translation initiation factor 3 subunit C
VIEYETQIKEFLENPVDSDAEKVVQQKEDDDDDDEPDQVDEAESDEDDKYLLQSNDPMVRRRYWLKKVKEVFSYQY